MTVSRPARPQKKETRIRQIADADRRAMELLEARGEAFTVPGFCRALLEVMDLEP